MESFLKRALRRKPLRIVQRQTHLCKTSPKSIQYDADARLNPSSQERLSETYSGINLAQNQTSHESRAEYDSSVEVPTRHMSLFDLTAFGITSTIGSGVFVLAGAVAHSHAGPSASISYLIVGVIATLSGLPYAELSSAIPMDGSTYSYAYVALGEGFAVMSSLCQSLLYGGTGAAVARSWGDKFVVWVRTRLGASANDVSIPMWLDKLLDPGYRVNPMAAIITLLCTFVLSCGVKESKFATNVTTIVKLSLLFFMIVGGFILASGFIPQDEINPRPASFSNLTPFIPPEFGLSGILKATSIVIFGYNGFDQICNLSGEAKNPVNDVPQAVVYTLVVDSCTYILASLALTAMIPYTESSDVSGFPQAFAANGWIWAATLTTVGELVVLPVVILASMVSQTRLLFAMSTDKLVPAVFGERTFAKSPSILGRVVPCIKVKEDKIGNLSANIRICGVVTFLLATFVPFQFTEGLISVGALALFSLTNCCLLTLRYETLNDVFIGFRHPVSKKISFQWLLMLLNILPIVSAFCLVYISSNMIRFICATSFAVLALGVTVYIHFNYRKIDIGHSLFQGGGDDIDKSRFHTPFMPYLPSLGIFVNNFFIVNIGWVGIVMLVGYLFTGVIVYGKFCAGKSLISRSSRDVIIDDFDGHEALVAS